MAIFSGGAFGGGLSGGFNPGRFGSGGGFGSGMGSGGSDPTFVDKARKKAEIWNPAEVDPGAFGFQGYQAGQQALFNQARQSMGRDPLAGVSGQQDALAALLMGQAQGGMTPAQQQLQQGIQAAQAQQQALAASQMGIPPALAQRLASGQSAAIAQQGVGQSQILRAQEAANAQNALGQVLSQRGGLRLDQAAANDSLVQFYMAQGLTREQAQMQAMIAQQQLQSQNINAARDALAGLRTADIARNAQTQSAMIGGAFSAAGAGLGAYLGKGPGGGGGGGGGSGSGNNGDGSGGGSGGGGQL